MSDEVNRDGPTASKKLATDRTVLADKKKTVLKDKKRTLKRLWNQFVCLCVWFYTEKHPPYTGKFSPASLT